MTVYKNSDQTLCAICQRRVGWNGKRWIHLVIYASAMHDARPILELVGDASDPWFAAKLSLNEAPHPS